MVLEVSLKDFLVEIQVSFFDPQFQIYSYSIIVRYSIAIVLSIRLIIITN